MIIMNLADLSLYRLIDMFPLSARGRDYGMHKPRKAAGGGLTKIRRTERCTSNVPPAEGMVIPSSQRRIT